MYGGIKKLDNSDYERIHGINGKVLAVIILWVAGSVIQYGFSRVVMNVTSPEYMFTCPFMILINASIFVLCYLVEIKSVSSKASMLIKYSLGIYIIHPFIITILQHFNLWDNTGWFVHWGLLAIISTLITAIIIKVPYLNRIVRL